MDIIVVVVMLITNFGTLFTPAHSDCTFLSLRNSFTCLPFDLGCLCYWCKAV